VNPTGSKEQAGSVDRCEASDACVACVAQVLRKREEAESELELILAASKDGNNLRSSLPGLHIYRPNRQSQVRDAMGRADCGV
jgi:hypothetical protein